MKVMDERPRNVVDVIEDMSRDVKLELYEHNQSTLRDTPQTEDVELLADQQRLLFSKSEESDSEDELVLATYTLHWKDYIRLDGKLINPLGGNSQFQQLQHNTSIGPTPLFTKGNKGVSYKNNLVNLNIWNIWIQKQWNKEGRVYR